MKKSNFFVYDRRRSQFMIINISDSCQWIAIKLMNAKQSIMLFNDLRNHFNRETTLMIFKAVQNFFGVHVEAC